jgi:negative regulator of sigma E activity
MSVLLAVLLSTATVSPSEIQEWLEDVDRARNAVSETVIKARASIMKDGKVTGSADFQVYAKGDDRGLLVFRGGKNDGRKILNVGEKMWLIVPGASRALPITANQRLLGGASVGDIARVRFAKDYTATARENSEEIAGKPCRVLDLAARSPAAAYPKVVLWFDEKAKLPCRILLSLPSGKPAKEVTFTKFQKSAGRTVVAEMEVRDLLTGEPGAYTRLEYLEVLPARIDDEFFTPQGALTF